MKIKSYQSGGIVYVPTSNQVAGANSLLAPATISRQGNTTQDNKISLSRNVIDMIKQNGLDNDVEKLLSATNNLLISSGDLNGEDMSLRDLLKIQRLSNKVTLNYERYKSAISSLDKEDAWNEVATDSRGRMYVQDIQTKGISLISSNDYINNRDKYIVLTNQDLLNIRKSSPDMAYREDILDGLSSSVGTSTIVKYIKDTISNFGSISTEGYAAKQNEKVFTGLNNLNDFKEGDIYKLIEAGPNGIYKISKKESVANSNIEFALNYLIKTLPKSYEYALNAKAAAEGYSPEALLMQMLYGTKDREYKADYDKNFFINTDGSVRGKGGSSNSDQYTKQGYIESLITMPLREQYDVYPRASDINSDTNFLRFFGASIGPAQDSSEKVIDKDLTLDDYISRGRIFQAALTDNITFGKKVINSLDAKNIVVPQNADLVIAEMPFEVSEDGTITPNFSALKKLNELQENISNDDKTNFEKAEEAKKIGAEFDPETNEIRFNRDMLHRFIVIKGAYAGSRVLDLDDEDKKFLENLKEYDHSDEIKDSYDRIRKYGSEVYSKGTKAIDVPRAGKLYRGNIFIPINESPALWRVYDNTALTSKSDFVDTNEKMILGQKISDANRTNDNFRSNF